MTHDNVRKLENWFSGICILLISLFGMAAIITCIFMANHFISKWW